MALKRFIHFYQLAAKVFQSFLLRYTWFVLSLPKITWNIVCKLCVGVKQY